MTDKRPSDIAEIRRMQQPPNSGRDLSQLLLRAFQCPSCRIEGKKRSLLVPVPGASSGSILRCYYCGQDFPAPDRE